MNVLYCGYNYRNVDNFRPLLDELAASGHTIGYCAFPYPNPAKDLELGEAPFQRLAFAPFNATLTQPSLPEVRDMVHRALREFSPDVVLLDDIFNYPSNAISTMVKEVAPQLPVVAFQHGFFQFWSHYRRFFACDFFLAYGSRSQREFLPHQQERVITFGLPKLSRLKNVPVSDDGTLLYLAQDTPRWEVVAPALKRYAKLTGRRVRVRAHPQFASIYEALAGEGLELQYAVDDVIPHLASCHAVVTTGSTAGMEALVLGKPVVSLPSYSSSIFTGSPCMALDYTGEQIWSVLHQWPQRQDELRSFLEDSISPLSFDMPRAARYFEELITRRIVRPPSTEAAMLEDQQRTLVAQQVQVELRSRLLNEEAGARAAAQARVGVLEAEGVEVRTRYQSEVASLREQLQATQEQLRASEAQRQATQAQLRASEAQRQASQEQARALATELEALRARHHALLAAKPPLRHQVVDLLNARLKSAGPLLHLGIKRAFSVVKAS
ncbi:hypothetical protein [Vitiosangium sp. GDMCC 1.1324]|uniref:hypothetical protein n=1 Tax=Vitiosangium sp. (strain GDMCC 1.1324) TaxID=2138576 RepID=UPI000D3DB835|nr:hypothetical protein [Vitiosangium sp. GDMCC 1.1324]PTL79701.1 hypothetical protein DAT35_33420 [Vitiosangium sp. GDMCC 1.1324]